MAGKVKCELLTLVVLFVLWIQIISSDQEFVTKTTRLGQVTGVSTLVENIKVNKFLGKSV